MKLYKLIDEYQEYGYLHNTFGYTESASTPMTYKSISPWGDSSGSGFGASISSFTNCEYFRIDDYGWRNLNDLAWELGVFPSTAGTSVLIRNGELSNVASLVLDGQEYLLLEKDLEPGWITPDVAETRGWGTRTYIVLNSETGAILGAAKGHELETVPIPACVIASPETECVPIPARVLESPEMVVYVPEPEPEPDYLDIFFYYNSEGYSVTFAANNYWAARIRNDSDRAELENFGVPIGTSGTGLRYVARTAVDSFTFTPIALYASDGAGDLQADMSNFYCALRSGSDPANIYYGVCIWSTSPYGTNTQTWKCRITKINGGN